MTAADNQVLFNMAIWRCNPADNGIRPKPVQAPNESALSHTPPVVLILSTAEDIAGGEIFLLSLIATIRDWSPLVATPNPELAKRCRALGANTAVVRGLRSLRRGHPLLAFGRICFCQSPALLRLLVIAIRSRADVIMGASFSAAHIAFALSRLLNRPALWSHQHPVLRAGDFDIRIASWLLSKGGMAAVACSRAVALSLGPAGLLNSNITVITNNVDVSHFRRSIPYSSTRRPVTVGLVAIITWWKGQNLLIEAVQLLKSRGLTERSFICSIIGGIYENRQKDRLYHAALLRCVAEFDLGKQVRFCGRQEDMKSVYENLDVVVSCSMEPEPFGLSIVEAMSMECVVVVPNEGGPAEIVRDGHNGFLFAPRLAEDLANKLQYVIENINVLDNIRRSARKSVCERFFAAAMARDYEAFFTQRLRVAHRDKHTLETVS